MKLLHVDDDPDIREIAELSLQIDPEIEVASAESAKAALAKIDVERPDVILLDVMMPEIDGPNFFGILRDRSDTTDIPVVFMTAAAQRHMIDDLIAAGAAGVISKPFDPMALASDLRNILERAK